MARILLAVPPMGASSIPPQLGVGYLASVLRAKGHQVDLVHADRLRWGSEEVVEHVMQTQPDLVGFTLVTMGYMATRQVCRRLRERGFGGRFILGGPHATALPELCLRQTGGVAVAMGEGEISVPELVAALEAGRGLERVPGVAWLDGAGRLRLNPPAPMVHDLDALPLPAWDLMPPRDYPAVPHQLFYRRFPTAPVITSRGCRFACSYCASAIVWGHRFRVRSAESVIEEIRRLATEHGVREIHIVDDDFTADENRVVELCEKLIAARLPIIWSCPNGIRTNTVNDRLASAMARAGCYQVGLGIDVVEQHQMRRVKKLRAPAAAAAAVATLRRWGIETRGFYLLGLDTDTAADLEKTIEVALSLPTEYAAFGLATPLPGAPDFDKFRREIDLETFDWSRLSYFVARDTPHLTSAELQRSLREAVLRFYARPRTLWGVARRVKLRQLPMIARGVFRYVTGKDLWRRSPSGGPRENPSPFPSDHFSVN